MLKSKKGYLLDFNKRVSTGRKIWRPAKWSGESSIEIIQKCHYQFFFWNHTEENYRDMVADPVQSYKAVACNMSLKVHFLDSHLDFFPENLGEASDEDEERFYQEISPWESDTKASWVTVCWLVTAGHLEGKLHKQNAPESRPLLFCTYCTYFLQYDVNTGFLQNSTARQLKTLPDRKNYV